MRYEKPAHVLLDWYDTHARVLPWRVSPTARLAGEQPDPYRVWLSEIMLQQTTVAAVRRYYERFTALWSTVNHLANADDAAVMAEWAGLGYYARARNLLKCARIVSHELGGEFPKAREDLLTLPGIGPYTASAIASIAFDQPETVVDGNVERVMARLPAAKGVLAEKAASLTPTQRPGDYAQAVMDLGATICTPRSPACDICPWMNICAARVSGRAADLPRKMPKATKPVRMGYVYVSRRIEDGAWIMERRPPSGLLGGMLGWPGSDWSENPVDRPPFDAPWQDPDVEVRHTFTHFHLRLKLRYAQISGEIDTDSWQLVTARSFRPSDMPTVMRKAYDLASGFLADQTDV